MLDAIRLMDRSKQDVQEKAFSLSRQYELLNRNCTQSTVCGILEALDISNNDVVRSATGLAGGVGWSGEGYCGAISGGVLAISYIFGRNREDFHRQGKMLKAIILSNHLVSLFKEKYGTCYCYELQTKFFEDPPSQLGMSNPQKSQKRDTHDECAALVGEVARLTVQIIQEQQAEDSAKAQLSTSTNHQISPETDKPS